MPLKKSDYSSYSCLHSSQGQSDAAYRQRCCKAIARPGEGLEVFPRRRRIGSQNALARLLVLKFGS